MYRVVHCGMEWRKLGVALVLGWGRMVEFGVEAVRITDRELTEAGKAGL